MMFTIYIRGRGFSFQLASSLNKIGKLDYLVTSYPKFIVKKYKIPNKKIKSVFIVEILIRTLKFFRKFLDKIKIKIDPHLIINPISDYLFSTIYFNNSNINIIGFGNPSCKIIKKSKNLNIKTLYFLNTNSPIEKEKIKNEYVNLGLNYLYKKENDNITSKINQNIKDADYIGCLSLFQKNNYKNEGLLKGKKVIDCNMGVDTSVFFNQNLKKDKFIVIGVGNDFVIKGFKYLIEAFNNLNLTNSELWLVGNLDKNVISKVIKLKKNNLIFNNINEFDLPKFYNQSSVFCLPTLTEGAPAVIPQAMSCGLPIIVTKNCQGPEVIDHNRNGFVVDEKNAESIEKKISYFYENPKIRYEMGLSAASFAKKNLSFDVVANKIASYFEKI